MQRAALVFTCVFSLFGCGGEVAPSRARSMVLITLDTTRSDALGAFGGPEGLTPNLDRLAAESIVFTEARTVAPLTLPAHASMLTGLYPPRHTLRTNALYALPEEASTLAERARAAGLETAAFVAAAVLDRRYGLDQGFDVYDGPPRPAKESSTHINERSALDVTSLAAQWLTQRDSARPFFLWVHLFDPHAPYAADADAVQAVEELGLPEDRQPYWSEVAATDAALGGLLEILDERSDADSTLLVVTADHGEGLGEHEEATHATLCYDTTMRVPLIVRAPNGLRAGERSNAIVSVVDVFSTAVAALGLGNATDVDGVDLLGEWNRDGVYFESYDGFVSYGWSPLAGWVDREAKYIHSTNPLAFRPEIDPEEQAPLEVDDDPTFERYRRALAAVAGRSKLSGRVASGGAEAQAQLQALGYTGAGQSSDALPHPLSPGERELRPTPMERTRDLMAIQAAAELQNMGLANSNREWIGRAAELLTELVERNPEAWRLKERLALCLGNLDQHARAAELYEGYLEVHPGQGKMHNNLAICYFNLNRFDDALRHVELALAMDSEHAEALRFMAHLQTALGRPKEAEVYKRRLEKVLSAADER